MTLSLNLSPIQLQDGWLSAQLLAVLTETGFPPHRLEVEITEHALITDLALAKQVITSLKNQGIRISLDDFGTGYSSLSYLSELPFDCIKIDRSFIRTLARAAGKRKGRERHRRSRQEPRHVDRRRRRRERARRRRSCARSAARWRRAILYSRPVPADELVATIAALERPGLSRAVA